MVVSSKMKRLDIRNFFLRYCVQIVTPISLIFLLSACKSNLENRCDPTAKGFHLNILIERFLNISSCGFQLFFLKSMTPSDGDRDIDSSAPIILNFNTKVAASSLSMQTEAGSCSGNFQLSKDGFVSCIAGTVDFSQNPTIRITPKNGSVCVSQSGFKVRILNQVSGENGVPLPFSTEFTIGYNTREPRISASTYGGTGVYNALVYCNQAFLAGDFTSIGKRVPFIGSYTKSGKPTDSASTLSTNGTIYALEKDPEGGFWIFGDFTLVNGESRLRVARLNASGSLLSQKFDANGVVRAARIIGNSIYLGGDFTTIGGLSRNKLAEINMVSGSLSDWNPGVSLDVRDIEYYNGSLYVVVKSPFSATCGTNTYSINGICKLYPTTGVADTGFASPTNLGGLAGEIEDMIVNQYGVFLSGEGAIDSIDAVARYNANTGVLDSSFTIMPGTYVYGMAYDSNILYMVGDFNVVLGGATRNGFVAYNLSNGSYLSANPFAAAPANANAFSKIFVGLESIYVTSQTARVPFESKNNVIGLFKLKKDNLVLDTTFSPNPGGGSVYSVKELDGSLIVGGDFAAAVSHATIGLGAINLATGDADRNVSFSITSTTTPYVFNITKNSDQSLFVAGGIQTINGISHPLIAKISLDDYSVITWNPQVIGSSIVKVHVEGESVYLGGNFTSVAGNARTNMTKVSRTTAEIDTGFTANATGGTIQDILIDGSSLWMAGSMTSVNSDATRARLAVVNSLIGSLASPIPSPNNARVVGLTKDDLGNILIGGNFSIIFSQSRTAFGSYSPSTGLINTSSIPITGATPQINAIKTSESDLYIGGENITAIQSNARTNFGHLKRNSSGDYELQPLAPNPDQRVRTIDKKGNYLYLFGEFSKLFGVNRAHAGVIRLSDGKLIE